MAVEKNKMNTLIHDRVPFTVIINDSINKIRDGFALGIYTYLSSKPEGWEIVNEELQSHFGVGRDLIKSKIKYLKDIGAITINQLRNGRGTYNVRETVLHSVFSGPTVDGKSVDGFAVVGETATIKERYIQNKDNINNYCTNEQKTQLSTYPETYYQTNQELSEHISEQKESDDTFEAFWQMYPVKKGKQRAKVAWFSQKCYKQVHMILTKLDEQIKRDRQYLDGYPPHPTTYIHGQLWNDEITPPPQTGSKIQQLDHNSNWHEGFNEDRF